MSSYHNLEEADIDLTSVDEKQQISDFRLWVTSLGRSTAIVLSVIIGLILIGVVIKLSIPLFRSLIGVVLDYERLICFVAGMLVIYMVMGTSIFLFILHFRDFIQNSKYPDVVTKEYEYVKWVKDTEKDTEEGEGKCRWQQKCLKLERDVKVEKEKEYKWQEKQELRWRCLVFTPLIPIVPLGVVFLIVYTQTNESVKNSIPFYIYFVSNILYLISILIMIIIGIALRNHPRYSKSFGRT